MLKQLSKPSFEPSRNEADVWELFHENSKVDKHKLIIPNDVVIQKMRGEDDSLDYQSFPLIKLAELSDDELADIKLCIQRRTSGSNWNLTEMSFLELSTLLQLTYGITRSNVDTDYEQPFRACPSGGGLYPLEIFLSIRNVEGLEAGLYHYNPHKKGLEFLREGDQTFKLSSAFVQRNVIEGAACVWLLGGMFRRSTFKYSNRGYRFVFLEAGHLAQNANLVATGLGLDVLNIGGYFDRDLDNYLNWNGVDQSVIYCLAFGRSPETAE
ncbi:MAG: SagB/ThcOx family dehydrogenase [Gammaproteobacteria bacterium]|jgi:SagB-type dehydrogenase family enzyme|nr:SagB/ThcOx family dehydrogenase [Gammaproteobacteria bacterium]MBT4722639.1 SagB/ThcOx family dehydrogenase [Candidatus Falkowbacteria bacterium]HIF51510.1 SagB/ThcOx family dehydrogenase [Thiotrichaceae bacterium]HIL75586.1 SagB/ThcOx family dehydrogenase [Rhodospirillales bacterium]MBT4145365.1 SagB/ThcOx family dehydrogenase [Gammaproteobacteria bacterium]